MNLSNLLQLQSAWSAFKKNHPKFPSFLKAISTQALSEGTVIEFHVKTPEGKTLDANLKLQSTDLELIRQLQDILS